MDPQVSITQGAQHSANSSVSQQNAAQQLSHRGDVFTQKVNTASLVENSLEELTFMVAEKSEKSMAKRKMASTELKTSALERAENYLKKVTNEEKQEKLNSFIDKFSQDPNAALQKVKYFLEGLSQDPSEQYSALEVIKQNAGNKVLEAQIDQLQKALYKEKGDAIRAGFNVQDTVLDFSSHTELITETSLTDFYRDAVLDYGGVADTFKKVITEHGEDNFASALDFIRQALGADLMSQDSSVAPEKLKAIVSDIKDVFTLKTVLDLSNRLIDKLQQYYDVAKSKQGVDLMGSSIELTEKKWISQRDFTQLPAKLDIQDIEAEVYFAHQLKGLLAKMPDSVFIDMTSRENLLDAATTYVHDTVEKEEE